MSAWALLALLLALQEQPSSEIRDLIDKLRSDSADVRGAAATRLRAIGRDAIPALEKEAAGKDLDAAAAARGLLRTIAADAFITPSLRAAAPDLVARLSGTDPRRWLEVFQAVRSLEAYPTLTRADRGALVEPALAAAKLERDIVGLCDWILQNEWTPATAGVADLLDWAEDPKLR